MIVKAISSEFEKVLAEQYHCQGLRIVTHSYLMISDKTLDVDSSWNALQPKLILYRDHKPSLQVSMCESHTVQQNMLGPILARRPEWRPGETVNMIKPL